MSQIIRNELKSQMVKIIHILREVSLVFSSEQFNCDSCSDWPRFLLNGTDFSRFAHQTFEWTLQLYFFSSALSGWEYNMVLKTEGHGQRRPCMRGWVLEKFIHFTRQYMLAMTIVDVETIGSADRTLVSDIDGKHMRLDQLTGHFIYWLEMWLAGLVKAKMWHGDDRWQVTFILLVSESQWKSHNQVTINQMEEGQWIFMHAWMHVK